MLIFMSTWGHLTYLYNRVARVITRSVFSVIFKRDGELSEVSPFRHPQPEMRGHQTQFRMMTTTTQ